jgi:peptide/nickel transport system substrate-binding protein
MSLLRLKPADCISFSVSRGPARGVHSKTGSVLSGTQHPDLKARSYDPDKARFHLKAAGLDSVDVKLSTADAAYTGAVDASVLYAEQAAKGGINITVDRTPNDGYWSQVWMKTPFFTSYWGGRPTEDAIITMGWSKASDSNESGMSDPRVEDLIKAARREGDEAKRRQIYGDIQQLISDEYSVVIPMFADFVFAANKKVVPSERVSGIAEMDGARCLTRWSFA